MAKVKPKDDEEIVVSVRLSREDIEELRRRAIDTDVPVARQIRRAVQDMLKRKAIIR